MKRILLALAAAAILVIAPLEAFTNSFGAPAGRTGSPAEGGATCNASGCHFGNALNSGGGSISVAGPASYTPGEAIELEVTVQRPSAIRIGFQISAVNAGGSHVGTLQIVDATFTQFASSNPAYVTHRNPPVGEASRTYRVGWVAPSAGTGDVTFFATGNAANGNGSSTGDFIYATTHTLSEGSGVDVETSVLPSHFSVLSAFPNPAREATSVELALPTATDVSLRIVDLLGREMLSSTYTSLGAGRHNLPVRLSGFPSGSYLITVQGGSGTIATRALSVIR